MGCSNDDRARAHKGDLGENLPDRRGLLSSDGREGNGGGPARRIQPTKKEFPFLFPIKFQLLRVKINLGKILRELRKI
jgi:hypothetical protein